MKKTIILTVLTLISVMMSVYAQDKNKKVTFMVSGNCEMCEHRIEKASLKQKGVKFAEWNVNTQMMTAIIDERKISADELMKQIAAVGHDNAKYKAPDEIYDKLPDCCKYRDPSTKMMDHH